MIARLEAETGNGRYSSRLEIFIPEPGRSVCIRCLLFNTQQLHDKVVDFDVLEPAHHVSLVRG